MNDTGLNALMLGLFLILPISALVARRMPISHVAKMATAWIAIFAVGLLLVGASGRFGKAWRDLTTSDAATLPQAVTIAMAEDGHFWADAEINGVRRRMLIDSGATTTALSEATVRAARIEAEPFARIVETANGTIAVKPATVARLTVGTNVVKDLPVVVSPSFGDSDVLGMNFLSQLSSWRVEGRSLILVPNR